MGEFWNILIKHIHRFKMAAVIYIIIHVDRFLYQTIHQIDILCFYAINIFTYFQHEGIAFYKIQDGELYCIVEVQDGGYYRITCTCEYISLLGCSIIQLIDITCNIQFLHTGTFNLKGVSITTF